MVPGCPGRGGAPGTRIAGALRCVVVLCGAVPPDSPSEYANGVGKAGAGCGRGSGRTAGVGDLCVCAGGAGIGGRRGIAIACWLGSGDGTGGAATRGDAFSAGAGGGGGGGGGSTATTGGAAGVGGTAGDVTPGNGDPGRGGLVRSGFIAVFKFGECPSNTIAKSAGGSYSARRGARSIVRINRTNALRCSANEAVSNGPSGRDRRAGKAIGDRPGEPGGNRITRCPRSMPTPTLRTNATPTAFYIGPPAPPSRGHHPGDR
jgi:hypothetical protein